jgi:uncharacterized small protein (DUF1192 family)
MAQHVAAMHARDQKERDTQHKYDEAMERERSNRHRTVDVHSNELRHVQVVAERNSDKAWQKVCANLKSQLGVLQTDIARLHLERVRQQANWDDAEEASKLRASTLRAELTVSPTKS